MKLELLLLGKTKDSYLEQGIQAYAKRIRHYVPLDVVLLKVKRKKGRSELQERQEEGNLLLQAAVPSSVIVALDGGGKQMNSEGFADFFSRLEMGGRKQVSFVIGGPTGHSQAVLDRADMCLSFSKMTFTHDMVRLFLLEQIYRAYTIKAGEKYHK